MIEIRKSKDEKPYYVVLADNGEVLVTSEMYESKQSLHKGIDALIGQFKVNICIQDEDWK